jgi:hypothetical protein
LITADLFNSIIDRLTPLANLTASGPYLLCDDDPYCGKLLRLAIPSKTAAKLTSDSSPYSWVEVDEGPGGTWVVRTVGGSGTNNAYEANNVSGLSGNVYWLTWTSVGDYRFQAIRYGCNSSDSSILISVTDFCTSLDVAGATVTVKLGTATIGTGTTDASGDYSTPITTPGNYTVTVSKSGYTTQTGVAISSVACGTVNTKSISLHPSTGSVSIQIFGACDDHFNSVATPGMGVVAKQGTTTVASGTTDNSGIVTLSGIPLGISTTLTASNSDISTQTVTQTFTLTDPCTTLSLGTFFVALDANKHCACWQGYPTSGVICLAGNTLLLGTPWGTCTGTYNATSQLWEGLLSATMGCPDRGCATVDTTLTVKYGFHSGEGACGWSVQGVVCSDGTNQYAFIPGGGTNHPTSTDTGSGGCNPFFATTTITYHLPAPWGNAEYMFCDTLPPPGTPPTEYTFSAMEP